MYQDGTEIQRHLPQKVQKCHLSLLDLQRLHCLETLFLHHSRQNLRIPHFFILLQKMGFWTTLSRIMNPSHSQLLDLSSQTPNSCRGWTQPTLMGLPWVGFDDSIHCKGFRSHANVGSLPVSTHVHPTILGQPEMCKHTKILVFELVVGTFLTFPGAFLLLPATIDGQMASNVENLWSLYWTSKPFAYIHPTFFAGSHVSFLPMLSHFVSNHLLS